MSIEVVRNDDKGRYEGRVDGVLAGYSAFRLRPGLVVFTHTQVEEAFEGQGVGGAIARAALDEIRAEGLRRVVPRCPFIADWIERHPDYRSLVADDDQPLSG